jgi:uncharacterized protein YdhG (YjbR/CyaY superfamily)
MATKKTAERAGAFTDVEREAMKARVREDKRARRGDSREEGEKDLLAKIAEMSAPDRAMAKRIHEIVTAKAPELTPSTWYGMPAYKRDGNVVCFFQPAAKFKARYATFGFNEAANLDEGAMWPTSFAVDKLTSAAEKMIGELVTKAVR